MNIFSFRFLKCELNNVMPPKGNMYCFCSYKPFLIHMHIDTYGFRYTSMGMILPEYVCFVGSICLLINGNVIEDDGKTNDEITATLIMVDCALWNVLYLYETDSW